MRAGLSRGITVARAFALWLMAAVPLAPTVSAQSPSPVTEVAASLHILILYADGTVVGLGENRSGQLASPPAIRQLLPAQRIALPGKAVQVVAAGDTSYALLEDGTVMAWGRGYSRELGVELQGSTNRAEPMPIPGLRDVQQIAAAENVAYALLRDGSVMAWGAQSKIIAGDRPGHPGIAQPFPVAGLSDIKSLSVSQNVAFALTREGRVYGWGANTQGNLGLGDVNPDPVPPTLLPTLRDVIAIATSGGSTTAVKRDGTVWTWGHNAQAGLGNGQHGDAGDPGQPTPMQVKGITDAVAVKHGSFGRHIIVLRANGTLIGWGNSDWGQLGTGRRDPLFQPVPTPIKLAGVEAYWLGGNFSFARTRDGRLWFWGEETGARVLLGSKGQQRVPAMVPTERILPARHLVRGAMATSCGEWRSVT